MALLQSLRDQDALPEDAHLNWHWANFPPEVERAFRNDNADLTLRASRLALLLSATVGCVMIGTACFGSHGFGLLAVMQLGIAPVIAVGSWLLGRVRIGLSRDVLFAALFTALTVLIAVEEHWATPTLAPRFAMACSVNLFLGLVLVPIRPRVSGAMAVTTVLICSLVTLLPHDPVTRGNWDLVLFGAVLAPIGWRRRVLGEQQSRRNFLLRMREERQRAELTSAIARLRELSSIDPLTGVGNRRSFDDSLTIMLAGGHHPGLLILDVDHFKLFNDRYGHPAGDACLTSVATAIRKGLSPDDTLARIGGEEFAILMRATSEREGLMLGERICRSVEALNLAHEARPDDHKVVTVSIGLALGQTGESPDVLTARADRALYEAKDKGRNRTVSAASTFAELAMAALV